MSEPEILCSGEIAEQSTTKKGKRTTSNEVRTMIGLAVLLDGQDALWYAVPNNQRLKENWTFAKCRWMYRMDNRNNNFGPVPEVGGEAVWFRLGPEEDTVFSYARFGIVTFYGKDEPHPEPGYAPKTIWALPKETHQEMEELYTVKVATEAQESNMAADEQEEEDVGSGSLATAATELAESLGVGENQIENSAAQFLHRGGGVWYRVEATAGRRSSLLKLKARRFEEVVGLSKFCNVANSLLLTSSQPQEDATIEIKANEDLAQPVWEGQWPMPNGALADVAEVPRPKAKSRAAGKRGREENVKNNEEDRSIAEVALASKPEVTLTQTAAKPLNTTKKAPSRTPSRTTSKTSAPVAHRVGFDTWSSSSKWTESTTKEELAAKYNPATVAKEAESATADEVRTVMLPSGAFATVSVDSLQKAFANKRGSGGANSAGNNKATTAASHSQDDLFTDLLDAMKAAKETMSKVSTVVNL